MNLRDKTELSILGMKHEVTYFKSHDGNDGAMGRSHIKHGIINICDEMPDDIQEQTILHEVVHIISDHLELEMKENQVGGLATGLYAFIKENKL